MGCSTLDLDLAQKQVDAGELRVRQQRELVTNLAADGHSTLVAKELLAELERALKQCLAYRDAIRAELKRRPVAWAYPNQTS